MSGARFGSHLGACVVCGQRVENGQGYLVYIAVNESGSVHYGECQQRIKTKWRELRQSLERERSEK